SRIGPSSCWRTLPHRMRCRPLSKANSPRYPGRLTRLSPALKRPLATRRRHWPELPALCITRSCQASLRASFPSGCRLSLGPAADQVGALVLPAPAFTGSTDVPSIGFSGGLPSLFGSPLGLPSLSPPVLPFLGSGCSPWPSGFDGLV